MSGDEELFGDGEKIHMGWFPSQREYFAAKALQGGLASEMTGAASDFAAFAVDMADALIAELNKS